MQHKQITIDPNLFPSCFQALIKDAPLFDSSCSPAATVFFIDKDSGYYLKRSAKGTLQKEAAMTSFFHTKQLGAEVLSYESLEYDWLLTRAIVGEDCIHPIYLEDPARLCDTTAALLRMLHETDISGCPVPDRTADYLATARQNYLHKTYDASLFPDNWGYASAEDAWNIVETNGSYLKSDTLLHGDYCLPNILLHDWRFSGFIDLDSGGVGDRHIDLFWATWSLKFNLKTDRYRERFLDVYGREAVNEDIFPIIAAIEVFG